MTNATNSNHQPRHNNLGLQLILLLGLVSAFGDITYETGRSVSGPFLALLGASAGVVGLVSGLGEFLGYALRLASGYLADRARAYWIATLIGYGLIFCIPLLAFANRWELAALLLILERIGKAIRSPSRDVILSYASHQTGRGWGFAIHEALDQLGAVIGPLVFSVVFFARNSYRDGFSILWIPAGLTILTLLVARYRFPNPETLETTAPTPAKTIAGKPTLPPVFWIYALFTFFSVAGFANFQIISYHLSVNAILPIALIPVLYAAANVIDALTALVTGKVYDKFGMISLGMIPFVTLLLPILAFSAQLHWIVISMILWGVVMATHESIMRAAIADMVTKERRGVAYGLFNTIYGSAIFLGSTALGFLYDYSLASMIWWVAGVEFIALAIFYYWRKSAGSPRLA